MHNKPYNRARNLDDKAITTILEILDGWPSTKLTWELLINQVTLRLRAEYSRQALHKHARISEAFAVRKKAIAARNSNDEQFLSPEAQRIVRLEAENERLKRENNNLLEQFQRWVYNGYLKQMDGRMRESMNNPLPQTYRDPSEKSNVTKIVPRRKKTN